MTLRPFVLRAGCAALLMSLALSAPARAGQTFAAVAANFTEAANEIATAFTAATGHTVTMSFGPAGQFYTQITQGAPFEVFLSADQARPEKAETEGFAVPGTRFTYAVGKLVLWSADPARIDGTEAVLNDPTLEHVAIADPAAAPYGAAAIETMKALGVYDRLEPKLVTGKSIAQAHQFVATGNAPVGFVALGQLLSEQSGSRWMVPQDLYAPIKQDAILLKTGEDNEAAKAYLDFLKTPEAVAIITKYGYGVEG
ncbi:molybdate ABC transporter substrate-binding protein [Rhodobacter veldkampii DSM 11550]|uniref:Molybdate ABC transporter substrate-binding protein n=2 Tax=Phaeovulum veldkampii TaxID=33049 RepID=A0A2T4JLW9_9RHOB|nr:molybdate ABC transporter substrate-binding protein [Phaeovulum veldkampii DSM 11550]NCU20121.1 molybdate ABC transporter substrate-binding protein [Candidatus Falkowbacteria bacterium]PTE18896.1 molybdate ABC transporter substrate-binding protein [Phaeovulum veldkampii DSM 11550]TDQ64621.1 molybdate transport system substrate-binding protein [Phaeovulum veldkampii DSM 11550]